MAKFIHIKELDPVNLDQVATIEQEFDSLHFLNDAGGAICIWKFKTEEQAYRAYSTIRNEYSEEL